MTRYPYAPLLRLPPTTTMHVRCCLRMLAAASQAQGLAMAPSGARVWPLLALWGSLSGLITTCGLNEPLFVNVSGSLACCLYEFWGLFLERLFFYSKGVRGSYFVFLSLYLYLF